MRCDHAKDADVEELFSASCGKQNQLDLLVNNAWGGYEQFDYAHFADPFWRQPMRQWTTMFEAGVRANLLASRFAAPLMIAQKSGLIVNITAWNQDKYLGNIFYDVAKAAVNRMTFGMAEELRAYNVAVVAIAPGFVGTERVRMAFEKAGRTPGNLESPELTGRAIVGSCRTQNWQSDQAHSSRSRSSRVSSLCPDNCRKIPQTRPNKMPFDILGRDIVNPVSARSL